MELKAGIQSAFLRNNHSRRRRSVGNSNNFEGQFRDQKKASRLIISAQTQNHEEK